MGGCLFNVPLGIIRLQRAHHHSKFLFHLWECGKDSKNSPARWNHFLRYNTLQRQNYYFLTDFFFKSETCQHSSTHSRHSTHYNQISTFSFITAYLFLLLFSSLKKRKTKKEKRREGSNLMGYAQPTCMVGAYPGNSHMLRIAVLN